MFDDVVSQALDPEANGRVYMAMSSRSLQMYTAPRQRWRVLAKIEPGSVFEVRAAEGEYHVVVTSDHVHGYVPKEHAYLQRIGGEQFENRLEGVEHGRIRR
jgi:SH3-like domain-containing protein